MIRWILRTPLSGVAGLIVAAPVLAETYQLKPTPQTVAWGHYDASDKPDSGATETALSTDTARAASLRVGDPAFPMELRTANGTIPAQTATVGALHLGDIVARDLPVVASPAFGDTNVLGMNFLSQLKSWRVEDGTLIMAPHHPQKNIRSGS